MSDEAFEIGVTLALSDGVSEGIERARRDMALLERALHSGGVSVTLLRQMATATVLPKAAGTTLQPRERPAGTVLPAPVVQSQAAAAEAKAEVDRSRERVSPAIAATPTGSVARETGVQEATVLPVTSDAGHAGVEIAARAPVGRRVAAPGQLAPVERLPEQAADARPGTEAVWDGPVEAHAPGRPVEQRRWPAAEADSPAGQVALPEAVACTAPAQVQNAASGIASSVVVHRLAALPEANAAAPAATAPRFETLAGGGEGDRGEPAWAELFPGGAGQPVSPVREASGDAGRAASAQAGGQADSVKGGPTEGDVFLDGMLVGRWMSRFLTQEAGRAQAGPTGFDPRRGRLLPGPTVGG